MLSRSSAPSVPSARPSWCAAPPHRRARPADRHPFSVQPGPAFYRFWRLLAARAPQRRCVGPRFDECPGAASTASPQCAARYGTAGGPRLDAARPTGRPRLEQVGRGWSAPHVTVRRVGRGWTPLCDRHPQTCPVYLTPQFEHSYPITFGESMGTIQHQ